MNSIQQKIDRDDKKDKFWELYLDGESLYRISKIYNTWQPTVDRAILNRLIHEFNEIAKIYYQKPESLVHHIKTLVGGSVRFSPQALNAGGGTDDQADERGEGVA